MQEIIRLAIKIYQSRLTEALNKLQDYDPALITALEFNTGKLAQQYVGELAESIPTGGKKEDRDSQYLYIFQFPADNQISVQQVQGAFALGRDQQKGQVRNLCQLNQDHHETTVLYVGLSRTPRQRFRQHLLKSATGTYAMHLEYWARPLNMEVKFLCYRLSDLDKASAQLLEDALWDYLQPLLGRRGSR